MKSFLTLDDLANIQGKTVLLRVDLNVPMNDGIITDQTRIERIIPTIEQLTEKGAHIVLLSHFGRPKGQVVPEMSLKPVCDALSALLNRPVAFCPETIGKTATEMVGALNDGDILMLENLRFQAEEEANNPAFADKLASLGDLYINDAFSAAHRAHASTHGLALKLPAYAGRLMEAELMALNAALENPARPLAALVGGAKISTKLDLLNNLVKKVDMLILGGGMANTFLYATGINVGASLCESDMKDTALNIIETAEQHGCEIILPVDGVVAKEFKANAANDTCGVDMIPSDGMMLDIGHGSVAILSDRLTKCKTIVWNGPMGAFELEPFDKGTVELARKVADMTQNGDLISVAGGGDTVAALNHAGVSEQFTYISTAGGAFLEWMEGKELPGVAVLMSDKAA